MNSQPGRQEEEQLQHAAEHEKPRSRNSVMTYLVVLFAAAFLLLLLSYFMQQRNSAETISSLKESVSAMQSVQDLLDQNQALEAQVGGLEAQVSGLQAELERANNQIRADDAGLRDTLKVSDALDHLRYLEELFQKKKHQAAKELIEAMEQTGLAACLPDSTAIEGEDILSPSQRYQVIYDALF